ncbi:MAG TPA: serine/threonine-protein kinase [Candidatus Angelobacter sp.]
MRWIPDQVVGRLQAEIALPQLEGTRYRPVRLLGSGGMGAVWLAEDMVLERQVALKVLSAENSSPELAARLMRETLVLARLEHPGIVPIHDAGSLPDGRSFYCMKYVQGEELGTMLARLNLRERLQLLQRVTEPLAFAHARGIVHRDLKPANIMIGPFGEVLIMDWGLAKIQVPPPQAPQTETAGAPKMHDAPTQAVFALALAPAPATTAHGSVLGTPGYMAPEQERGEMAAIDQRADVYALGAILKLMLQTPVGTGPSLPRKSVKAVEAICRKAMAPEIASRYASVGEMSADLARYLEGLPVSAYPESFLERAGRFLKRHQAAVVLVLMYLLMRVFFLLFFQR